MPLRHVLSIAAVLIATLLAFLPVLSNGFVNWDDPSTIVDNPRLAAPGILKWAFTTSEMSHYQPLAWLVWSASKTAFGLDATGFHALSLAGHLLNVALVYLLGLRLSSLAGLQAPRGQTSAVVGAFAFAIHPLRVESVAWASAFPYVLSLVFLLSSLVAYLTWAGLAGEAGRTRRAGSSLWLSVILYALSQLTRASAVAFPFVLLLIDVYPLRRLHGRRGDSWQRLIVEKIPFFVVALAAGFGESRARELATLQEVGLGARFTMAATAPFIYLWRTLVPVRLSPLDPLPIEPRVAWIPLLLGVAGLIIVTLLVWRSRAKLPVLVVAWSAYVLLLAPALGLTPSGQQATADRYTYIPSVVLSLLIGGTAASERIASQRFGRAIAIVVAVVVGAALIRATWHQTAWWHDSITMWTRAAELDPGNDIATYNLAIALVDAGREDEAVARFEQTLRLVPDHDLARHNLELIREKRVKKDVFDVNARAFALVQSGRHREAADALTQALKRYPDNHELAHNLARLLATTPDATLRDGALALRLALAVRERTGGRDPRVLDTLAAAYAAQGQFDLSRETSAEAVRIARAAGDVELARAIEAQALLYQRRPPNGRR